MALHELTGRRALVTGAGSGIGREIALALARAGADLVLCDVEAGGLAHTGSDARLLGRDVLAHVVDVASRGAMEAFATEVHARHGALDILVNNAGVGLGATFADTSLEDWGWVLGVNLWGVIHGCHFFVPPMVARGRGGHVVNVASAAGIAASSLLAAYSTSKFAVVGLSEALREELHAHGIGVTTVCPGVINTPITRRSPLRGLLAAPGARERLVAEYERRNYGPDRVAAAVVKAIRHDRALLPVAPEAWFIYLTKRVSPGLAAWIGHTLARQRLRAAPERSRR